MHDAITITEQVHCHPYPPLTTIAFIFTQNDYVTDHQGFWPAASDTVVVYSQVQCSQQSTWRELCMSHAIQAHTRRAFGRSGPLSKWSYSTGHQFTVAAAIASRTILDSTSHSPLVVVTGFGRHALKQQPLRSNPPKCCIVYGTPTPPEINNVLMRREMSPLVNRMILDYPRAQNVLLWSS